MPTVQTEVFPLHTANVVNKQDFSCFDPFGGKRNIAISKNKDPSCLWLTQVLQLWRQMQVYLDSKSQREYFKTKWHLPFCQSQCTSHGCFIFPCKRGKQTLGSWVQLLWKFKWVKFIYIQLNSQLIILFQFLGIFNIMFAFVCNSRWLKDREID